MENKGLLLIGAILIALFLVAVISATNDFNKNSKDVKDLFSNCTKECRENKQIAHQNCILVHKNESTQIREVYKKCTKDLKDLGESYKNNTVNNTINKTEFRNKIKECTTEYLSALKEADKKRKECFKNASINCEKKCKEEVCNNTQAPVCGINNVTYQNNCQLKKAEIKKACDGECPCIKIECKNYYWYDNSTQECSKKKFCGAFMYGGLRVFEKRDDCLKDLNKSICTKKSDCPTLNCIKAPCAFYSCEHSQCILKQPESDHKNTCTVDSDCVQLGVACAPSFCPSNKCIEGHCKIIDIHENCRNNSTTCDL